MTGRDEYQRLCCVHCFSLLMMIRINICTTGTDNGDMAFVSHLWGMEDVSCRPSKGPSPWGGGARFYWNPQSVTVLHTV